MADPSLPRFRAVSGFDEGSADRAASPLRDERLVASAARLLWRYRSVLLLALVIGAVLGWGLARLVPDAYEARSTVFITPPNFSNDLSPRPLAMEAYEELAQSEYIRDRLVAELRSTQALGPEEAVGSLSTTLYASRDPQRPFLPLIDLIARSATPALAQAAANAWADVFVLEQARLAGLGKSASIDFILDEFPKASARVLAEERKLKELETTLDREMTVARAGAAVDLKRARLSGLQRTLVRAETELFEVHLDSQSGSDRLARLEGELAKTPPVLTLTKGLSDEALLSAAASAGGAANGNVGTGAAGGKAPPPAGLSIRTEETNPTHVALTLQLAEDRVTVGALGVRARTLTDQIAQLRKEAAALTSDLLGAENQLAALQRQQSIAVAPLSMAVSEAQAQFGKLEAKIGDAQIAKATTDSDVKLGARAELPAAAVGPGLPIYVGAASLVALVAAAAAILLLAYLGALPAKSAAA